MVSSTRPPVQFLRMGQPSKAVIDAATFRVVVDGQGFFEMHGHFCTRLDVHRGERLAVELVHPGGHVLHATGEDAAHGFVRADAHGADRAVAAHVGDLAAVGVDQRGARQSLLLSSLVQRPA